MRRWTPSYAACAPFAAGRLPFPTSPLPNPFLDRLVDACHRSVATAGASVDLVPEARSPSLCTLACLRAYDADTAPRVRKLYAEMRRRQCVEHVLAMRAKYTGVGKLGSIKLTVFDALERLQAFVDVSDPDVTVPNLMHAYQTAEGLRAAGLPDWLQLTGLVHDLGKMIHVRGCDADGTSVATQWSIVGDTWVVGCRMPGELVFPELNDTSPDARHPERTSELGIYQEGCGLDADVHVRPRRVLVEVLRQSPRACPRSAVRRALPQPLPVARRGLLRARAHVIGRCWVG